MTTLTPLSDVKQEPIRTTPGSFRARAALGPGVPPPDDAAIRALASEQHGVVGRAQLAAAGLLRHAIDNRVRNGRLRVLYRGVYRVPGPIAGRREAEMAAVMAAGPGAVLSHGSAAALWKLGRRPEAGAPVQVSVVGRCPAPGPGVRVRRVARLAPGDRTILDGIPVTTAARTIVDLAADATPRELEQAVAAAMREGLADGDALVRAVASQPSRPGIVALRAILTVGDAPAFTRSEAEERLLALVRRARLPVPRTNARVCGHEVDFHWAGARLVVEVDGFEHHRSAHAFERDRRRDADLIAAGYRVMRVTWRHLGQPEALLVRIARALATAGGQ